MRVFFIGIALLFTLLLTGCGIGGYSMTGMVLEKDLKSIKSYGEYWVKEGMTVEQKRRDSWACGAALNITSADRPDFTPAEIQAAKRTEDPNDIAAIHRLRQAWGECMKSKGYEYRRTSP
jgi:hypothetical protein